MPPFPLVLPAVRACAWFEAEPPEALAQVDPGEFLQLDWGPPDVSWVEPLQRRRLSRMARGFLHCAQRLAPAGDLRVVFASQHGEAERTLGLLQDLAAGRELSPALFSMSVHNAVPGLWSILAGNRAPLSAVAAGPETFGWGLVEAIAAWAAGPGAPVLYIYADDRLPEPLAQGVAQPGLHAVGLLLGATQGRSLSLDREGLLSQVQPSQCQAHHFLAAWQGGDPCWAGPRGRWRWQFACSQEPNSNIVNSAL